MSEQLPKFENETRDNFEQVDRYELLALLSKGNKRYLGYHTDISTDGKKVLWLEYSSNIKFGPFELKIGNTADEQTVKVPKGFMGELKNFMEIIKRGADSWEKEQTDDKLPK